MNIKKLNKQTKLFTLKITWYEDCMSLENVYNTAKNSGYIFYVYTATNIPVYLFSQYNETECQFHLVQRIMLY